MNNKIADKNVDFLFKAILALETTEECYDFFEEPWRRELPLPKCFLKNAFIPIS